MNSNASSIFHSLSLLARVLAWICFACVVLLCFSVGFLRPVLVQIQTAITILLPEGLRGVAVIPTPFGGAFRGDFALIAVVLFLLDWLFIRLHEAFK
ncbi:hypothetical protein [Atopobium fossor]|uniref:hypothetical protein n=1 Tax=Atopobium fossor TaxID=39487 RepID=UPI0004275F22|nr:hypothetical protein [Atopobium fossor]